MLVRGAVGVRGPRDNWLPSAWTVLAGETGQSPEEGVGVRLYRFPRKVLVTRVSAARRSRLRTAFATGGENGLACISRSRGTSG